MTPESASLVETSKTGGRYRKLRDVALPPLVSSCCNLLLAWLYMRAGCLGLILTAPMVLLAVQEFLYFGQVPSMSPEEMRRRGRLIGLFELGIGLFNPISFVCGVILLLALRRRSRNREATSDLVAKLHSSAQSR